MITELQLESHPRPKGHGTFLQLRITWYAQRMRSSCSDLVTMLESQLKDNLD